MLEQRRQDYLTAMGIPLWMPRAALPYAPQPRRLAVAQPHALPPHQISAGAGHIVHPLAAELMHESVTMAAERVTAPAAVVPLSGSGKPEILPVSVSVPVAVDAAIDLTPPRFELQFLRVSQAGVWVFEGSEPADRLQSFAWRVLQAMTQDTGFMQAPFSFRWPFIESVQDDQSRSVAIQALTAQWRFFQDQGAEYVICFGPVSQEWFSAIGVTPLYLAPSLAETMVSAAAKRQLWQVLHQRGAI